MAAKKSKSLSDLGGLVYSTNPDFKWEQEMEPEVTAPENQQALRIRLDTKHRAGKAVSLIEGFKGSINDLEELAKKLKTHCGTGGSAKDQCIIIQGDNRSRILQWLLKNGYSKSRIV